MATIEKLLQTIVVINDFSHVNGGASQVALASAKGLAHRGYRVILFSAVAPVDPGLREAGVEVVHTGQHEIIKDPSRFNAAVQGLWNTAARRKLRTLLRTLDPNRTILHVHSWVKALSSSVIREAAAEEFSVVCTLHDYFAACPNGGFFDYQKKVPCGEVALSGSCIRRNCDPRSYKQKLWRVARQVIQVALGGVPGSIQHFILVSSFSEQILRRYLPSTSTIDQVTNPIEAERCDPADLRVNNRFVYVGRLSPEKGAVTLAEAAFKLGIRAVFVGDGPDSGKIKAACPNAEITGWLSRESVIKQIRLARALVMTSLWYETQGLVVSEAAAQGVPAVVSDRCAARDAVRNGKTGLWYAGGDSDDLALKINAISGSPNLEVFGRNAYDSYWANPMSLEWHVGELERLFTSYLLRRGRTYSSVA